MTNEQLISNCNQIMAGIQSYRMGSYFICLDAYTLRRDDRLHIVELLEEYGNKYIEGFFRDEAFMYMVQGMEVKGDDYNKHKIEHIKSFINYVVEGGNISLIEK